MVTLVVKEPAFVIETFMHGRIRQRSILCNTLQEADMPKSPSRIRIVFAEATKKLTIL